MNILQFVENMSDTRNENSNSNSIKNCAYQTYILKIVNIYHRVVNVEFDLHFILVKKPWLLASRSCGPAKSRAPTGQPASIPTNNWKASSNAVFLVHSHGSVYNNPDGENTNVSGNVLCDSMLYLVRCSQLFVKK